MRRVFLDTNLILDTVRWKVDLFGEIRRICDFAYDIVVLDRVFDELKKFQALGGKKKELGSIALLILASNKDIITLKTKGGHVDDLLVSTATKKDIVATQDQRLKQRLKSAGIGVIVIREKGYLSLIERGLS